MRISTNTIFASSTNKMSDLQVGINKTQQQISSGRRVLTPEDDPIGSARALVIQQADSMNEQFATNRKNITNTLSIADGVLGNVTDTLNSIKSLIVKAGGGVLTDSDRASIATELQGNLDHLMGLANSTDGTGGYLFSGYSTTTSPFSKTINGANYNGDQGQRYLQVDSARQLPLTMSGDQIFGNIRTAATTFNVQPNPSNIGQGVATASIANASALTGQNYELNFDVTGTQVSVVNKTTGATVLPATPYVSGGTISFDGIDMTITSSPAAPAPGDKFSIQPGNQNIFETLTDLVNALNTPVNTVAGKKDLTAALQQANGNLDKSLNNVLTARGQIGVSLKEVESLDSEGDAKGLAFKQSLAEIQDVDYVKAISDLTQQQFVLQAAQQSFVKTANLSLFSYIN
ncbi:flagellar hook-associated protein FlgL [Undibacterium squillarum]|uniref:flagellar hook-associated protein FlgL n=1 Tax=Undibacterium squillarum TaxID=1131567 RepID=UPI0035ADF832